MSRASRALGLDRRRRRLPPGLAGAALSGGGREAAPRRLRVSAVTVPGTPWHALWERFGERARRALPRHVPRLRTRGELGGEEQAIAQLRRGRIELAGLSLQGAATLVPELNLILAPFQFEDPAVADALLDGPLFAPFAERFGAKGLALLQWAEVGHTHLYARRPLRRPEALRGIRMRASNALGARLFGRALGMNQVPVSFGEVLTALETGLIEGGQSGTGLYALAGLVRHAPHLSLTAHAYDAGVVVANLRWWEALAEDERAAVRSCLDSPESHRREVRAFVAELEAGGRERRGGVVHRRTAAERAAWREAARPVAGLRSPPSARPRGRSRRGYRPSSESPPEGRLPPFVRTK
ncbi:MAG: TRAP transporter substrate-binding protein DctP [Xanthomonadales bacterium]|nr:TRAP transporter substrate-binding protein DctP [Xanthomonadales bacterium]